MLSQRCWSKGSKRKSKRKQKKCLIQKKHVKEVEVKDSKLKGGLKEEKESKEEQ